MDESIRIDWGRAELAGLYERWPKDERGEPEAPVLLCTLSALDMRDELMLNMLEAFGIPCLRQYIRQMFFHLPGMQQIPFPDILPAAG